MPTNLFSVTGMFTTDERDVNAPFGGFFIRIRDSVRANRITGLLTDGYGQSEIDGAYGDKERLNFNKFYSSDRTFAYEFRFDKRKGLWLGTYQGKTSKGKAFCQINPIASLEEGWVGYPAKYMIQRGRFRDIIPHKPEPLSPPYCSNL